MVGVRLYLCIVIGKVTGMSTAEEGPEGGTNERLSDRDAQS